MGEANGLMVAEQLLTAAVAALGGTPRAGQQQMVAEVSAAIDSHETLLVQAGTGTGKTMGYLVPAACHAVETGERVVVATATLALQRQLLTRDLPLLAEVATTILPQSFTFTLLKGRQNYVCKYKLDGGYPIDEPTLFSDDDVGVTGSSADTLTPVIAGLTRNPSSTHPVIAGLTRNPSSAKKKAKAKSNPPKGANRTPESFVAKVRRVREWANDTNTGDRDDLVPGVSDRAWRQVSIGALECLGAKCPMIADCFSEQARAAARESDIVVTNHAMLGIAASGSPGVLPEYDVLVVDEAHNLESAVISGAIVELSQSIIDRVAKTAQKHLGIKAGGLEQAGLEFAIALAKCPNGRFADGVPEALQAAIVAVQNELRPLVSAKPQAEITDGAAKVAQSALVQLFEVVQRMSEPSQTEVLWCTADAADGANTASKASQAAGTTPHRLYAGPYQAANLIKDHLLGDAEATGIFTSATLTIGGTFTSTAISLGLSPDSYRAVDVGSPFDYGKQGILYIAAHLPKPQRQQISASVAATGAASTVHQPLLDEIEALIKAAGGRTLGLFSSRRAAELAATAMRDRLDTPVLLQGDDQLPTLIEQFASDPAASLFGTISLWQGIDVPGPSCQLVIIDKLGFPRPDDPISSARVQAVEQAGGNGFMTVSVNHSALRLAQAAGRLIRHADDRGVVAVLDPRLVTARYGSTIIKSMPPFWRTTNRDTVLAALARLNNAAAAPENV